MNILQFFSGEKLKRVWFVCNQIERHGSLCQFVKEKGQRIEGGRKKEKKKKKEPDRNG